MPDQSIRYLVPALLAASLGIAAQLHAQAEEDQGPAFLKVCNKGTVTVSAVIAVEDDDLLPPYTLKVRGWAPLEPGNCQLIYESMSTVYIPIPAYIGFAFFDASGRFTPARVGEVPDLGQWVYASRYANLRWPKGKGPVLVTASKRLCVHQRPMSYELGSKSDVECSSFHPGGDASPYYPLVAQLFFHPAGLRCYGSPGPLQCYHGRYFLDVAPKPGDPNLRASAGTDPSEESELAKDSDRPRKQPSPAPREPPPPESTNPLAAEARRSDSLYWAQMWTSPRASVGAFEPSWMGKKMVLRGTVSHIVEGSGNPSWVNILFKESPDMTVIGCSPAPYLLRELFGDNLTALVGKAVEMAGEIEPSCGSKGGIRIVDRHQMKIVPAR